MYPTAIHFLKLTIRGSACCVDRFGRATRQQFSSFHRQPASLGHREEMENLHKS